MSAHWFSLDTRLLQWWSALKTQQGIRWLTQTNDLALQGDIFRTLYEQHNFPQQQSNRQWINAIMTQLSTWGKCILDSTLTNDVLFVLTTIPDIRQELYTMLHIPLNTRLVIGDARRRQSTTLQKSCRNIVACLRPDKQYDNKESINSQNELTYCRRTIREYFLLNQQLSQAYLTQTSDVKDMNVYINNTLDDSPFDLMVDMQDIKKILFLTDNPVIPRMTFFSLPTVSVPDSTNSSFWWINALLWANNTVWENSVRSANIGWEDSNTNITTADTSSPITAFIESNQATTNEASNNTRSTTIWSANLSLIEAPLCLPTDTTASWITDATTIDDDTVGDTMRDDQASFSWAQAALMASLAPFLSYDDNRIGEFGNTLLDDLDNLIQTTNPIPWANCQARCDALPTTGGASDDIQKQTCEANCCIDSCKTLTNLRDKAVCLSQCLCVDTSYPGVNAKPELKKVFDNDMLRIRFCRVPAMNPIIQANKKITTIEEAIDGINAILGTLKAWGKLTPRNKSKEFLDSTFSDIKFKDIIAFDIFVAVKPLYDTISFAGKAKAKQQSATADRALFIPGGKDLSESHERNKYIIIGSHAPALASKQPLTSYQDYQQLMIDQQKKLTMQECPPWQACLSADRGGGFASPVRSAILDDQKQWHDEILDELAEFYRANMLFRQQITDKTDSFHQTSQSFAEKAIKAK